MGQLNFGFDGGGVWSDSCPTLCGSLAIGRPRGHAILDPQLVLPPAPHVVNVANLRIAAKPEVRKGNVHGLAVQMLYGHPSCNKVTGGASQCQRQIDPQVFGASRLRT